ncbi:MAG: ribulose-phosphate 3-epimerase, partial [Bacillota bacterium]|nr:ribulose-phosphate 3-epimerase [Bacillota bacterium]
MIHISPSFLSADIWQVSRQISTLEAEGCRYLHLDVMDGRFVPNISFGIPVIKGIRKYSNKVFDVHLMIVEPEKYIEEFRKAG